VPRQAAGGMQTTIEITVHCRSHVVEWLQERCHAVEHLPRHGSD
jgi:hypothetical protein